MKKLRNEKGFAMAELLAVCIIVLGIFAVLFSNYLPLTAEYENRVTYNNVNAEYAATYIRKAFKDVKVYDALKNLDTTGYYTLYTCESGGGCEIKDGIFTKSDGTSRNSEYEKKKNQIIKFINEYGIQEIIITKYKTKEVKDKYKSSGLLYNYIKYIPTFKDSKVTKTGKYRIILKTKDYGYATVPLRYAEPNEPKLDSDMLPVYFDSNNKIIVADKTNESVTNEWYDYVEKKWANVVKLSSNSTKKIEDYTAGEEVKLMYIQTMWVWIPRYKYKEIKRTSKSTAISQINVTFITQGNEKDVPHPAFGDNKSKKTGFWIGKYESGNSTIKPDITPTAGTDFTGSGVITNKEWGAVAYLAYSRYGTCNSVGEKTVCNGVAHDNTIKTGSDDYRTATTGNAYGVFDMNGGKYELIDTSDKGLGTGSEKELTRSKEVVQTFDHLFMMKDACRSCTKARSCTGSGENRRCHSYCSCHNYPCLRWTHNRHKQGNRGVSQNCKIYDLEKESPDKTAKGKTYLYGDKSMSGQPATNDNDSEAGCSNNFNLRGGSVQGNAWCIKTKVDNDKSTQEDHIYAEKDTEKMHFDDGKGYSSIFAYSSSDFVKSNYIVTRSVIRN